MDAKVCACSYIACYPAPCQRAWPPINSPCRKKYHQITSISGWADQMPCDNVPRYCAWLQLSHCIEREACTIADVLIERDGKQNVEVDTLNLSASSNIFATFTNSNRLNLYSFYLKICVKIYMWKKFVLCVDFYKY